MADEFRLNTADMVVINGAAQISATRVWPDDLIEMTVDMLRSALPHTHVEHRWIGPLVKALDAWMHSYARDKTRRDATAQLDLDRAVADVLRWRLAESWARFEDVKKRSAA